MRARTLYRTEAIVLRILDYGESDRIVTFCTRRYGKIRGIAKGARRSRKRFANALEPYAYSQVLFTRRGAEGLAMIDSSEVISHFPNIRADLEKTLRASYLIDLADQFLPEEKKSEAIFQLLLAFLRLIEEHAPQESLQRFFELRMLKLAGYDPVLDRCLRCRTAVHSGTAYSFTAADGGLICSTCRPASGDAIPLKLGTIRTLMLGRDMPVEGLGRIILSGQSANESRQLLTHFIRHLLGRELKSLQVLNEIRRLTL